MGIFDKTVLGNSFYLLKEEEKKKDTWELQMLFQWLT